MSHSDVVIAYAKRSPIGKLGGALSSLPAPRLTAPLIADALESLGCSPSAPDEIIMGNVLTSGIGQAPARQAAIYGGLDKGVSATTIGKVCGSGMKAIMLADQAIRTGDASIVFAGGQESMSRAPHLLMDSRNGYRFGSVEAKDSMQWDGLWDPYNDVSMGSCGEVCAEKYDFSREAQDEYTLTSYRRSRQAVESGSFAEETLPIKVLNRKKETLVEVDEEPFSVDLDRITSLRPAFKKDGTITAANASSINDGSALLVICSRKAAVDNGWKPMARIVAQASFAHEPELFTTAPIGCIEKLLNKADLTVKDIDLFEINEAFAVVPMAAAKQLAIDYDRLNVNGGAVSLGHPIGASGARIVVTLIHALRKRNLNRGLATLCIGGGEASGIVIELT